MSNYLGEKSIGVVGIAAAGVLIWWMMKAKKASATKASDNASPAALLTKNHGFIAPYFTPNTNINTLDQGILKDSTGKPIYVTGTWYGAV